MAGWAEALSQVATGSPVVRAMIVAVPVAVTVSFLAGWRARVENTLAPAIWGALLCLWIGLPFRFEFAEMNQLRGFVSILGWLWLVMAWARHVLGEWPEPIWGHWIVGTLLTFLPVAIAVELIRL